MAKTTKFWGINPSNIKERTLMASFTVKDGKVTDSKVEDSSIRDYVRTGIRSRGDKVTLKGDGEKFVQLLAANFAMSSFVSVEED